MNKQDNNNKNSELNLTQEDNQEDNQEINQEQFKERLEDQLEVINENITQARNHLNDMLEKIEQLPEFLPGDPINHRENLKMHIYNVLKYLEEGKDALNPYYEFIQSN